MYKNLFLFCFTVLLSSCTPNGYYHEAEPELPPYDQWKDYNIIGCNPDGSILMPYRMFDKPSSDKHAKKADRLFRDFVNENIIDHYLVKKIANEEMNGWKTSQYSFVNDQLNFNTPWIEAAILKLPRKDLNKFDCSDACLYELNRGQYNQKFIVNSINESIIKIQRCVLNQTAFGIMRISKNESEVTYYTYMQDCEINSDKESDIISIMRKY